MYERIKRFYSRNLWTIGQVWDAVGFKVITTDEYKTITKVEYDPNTRPTGK